MKNITAKLSALFTLVLATVLLASTAQAAAPTTPTPDSVTAGELTVTGASLKAKDGHIDFFLSIKNAGKLDETLIGAGTPLTDGDVVEVKKDKDGKETESPVSIPLPAGKTTTLSADDTWLRAKDVKTEPKATDVVPFNLYTRRSPNIALRIPAKSSGGSGLLDWFKK